MPRMAPCGGPWPACGERRRYPGRALADLRVEVPVQREEQLRGADGQLLRDEARPGSHPDVHGDGEPQPGGAAGQQRRGRGPVPGSAPQGADVVQPVRRGLRGQLVLHARCARGRHLDHGPALSRCHRRVRWVHLCRGRRGCGRRGGAERRSGRGQPAHRAGPDRGLRRRLPLAGQGPVDVPAEWAGRQLGSSRTSRWP